MKRTGAPSKSKTSKRWSQKLQVKTRWTDINQRIELLKQSAQYIDENYAKGIRTSDIHQKLGVHPKKLNDIFRRFYGVSASAYLRDYKCKVLFAKIRIAPGIPQEDHFESAGMAGNPSERRAFKSLHNISVDEHWMQSKSDSSGDHERGGHASLPNALREAEQTIKQLTATITELQGT
jgi:hypothetical protein